MCRHSTYPVFRRVLRTRVVKGDRKVQGVPVVPPRRKHHPNEVSTPRNSNPSDFENTIGHLCRRNKGLPL